MTSNVRNLYTMAQPGMLIPYNKVKLIWVDIVDGSCRVRSRQFPSMGTWKIELQLDHCLRMNS